MRELEKKRMLTRQEYNCLRCISCQNVPGVFQTNYYFDTDDFAMNKRGVTCRIRFKNGVYKATIKTHGIQEAGCSIEEDLSEKTYFDQNAFSSLGIHLQGDLVTERTVMFKDNTCEMVLDRNMYLGTTDYELEIEYLEGCEDKANRLMNEAVEMLISHEFIMNKDELQSLQCKSKSERFFERKLKRGGE